jgi:predicted RNA-binding Zn ribbon-like protein
METKPAPLPLLLLQSFVNTVESDSATDLLREPATAHPWLRESGLLPEGVELSRADLRRLREIREALRSLLEHNAGHGAPTPSELRVLRSVATGAVIRLHIGSDIPGTSDGDGHADGGGEGDGHGHSGDGEGDGHGHSGDGEGDGHGHSGDGEGYGNLDGNGDAYGEGGGAGAGVVQAGPESPDPVLAAGLRLLLIVRDSQRDDTWPRLKACRNPECRWAFYDRSHSQQGRWCDMSVCGNRIKNRALRARQRGG